MYLFMTCRKLRYIIMTIQVLVATMDQKDYSLPKKMNIKCDAIIGNQCNYNSIEEIVFNNHKIKYLNFAERGVGLNRNNALMRAEADICLFADDDMVYCDEYVEVVEEAFTLHPDADVIAFNLIEKVPNRYTIKEDHKIRLYNFMRYGTARIAVKLSSIRKKGILFDLNFGGGTKHSHGEDTIFLSDCIRNGLNMYAVPSYIAILTEERESTWNKGYSDKFFYDQGCLYKRISPLLWKLLCLQDAIRHYDLYNQSIVSAYMKMTRD